MNVAAVAADWQLLRQTGGSTVCGEHGGGLCLCRVRQIPAKGCGTVIPGVKETRVDLRRATCGKAPTKAHKADHHVLPSFLDPFCFQIQAQKAERKCFRPSKTRFCKGFDASLLVTGSLEHDAVTAAWSQANRNCWQPSPLSETPQRAFLTIKRRGETVRSPLTFVSVACLQQKARMVETCMLALLGLD